MAHVHSAADLEVARILGMLPHLVWEAQHPRPCTHNLRWGARKRRSAGNDEPLPPPPDSPSVALPRPRPPPLRHPAAPPRAVKKINNKKRGGDHTKPRRVDDASEEKPTPGTSSPETPLDFCPSGEEPDAKAKPRPPDVGWPPAKRPKSSRRELAKRVDLLIHTRTELQKEAAEARSRLQAERWRYSELVELRIKMEKETAGYHLQQQQQQQQHVLCGSSCFDLPPTCVVRSIPRAHDHAHPGSHNIPHEQPYQHLWPKQWANKYPLVHHPTAQFSIHPSFPLDHQPTAQAGKRPCDRVAPQPLGLTGSLGGSRPCKIPDLNTRADEDLAWS